MQKGCFKWGCLFPILSILVLALFATLGINILSFSLDVPVRTLVSCAIHGIDVRTVAPIKKKTVMLPGKVPLELVWVPAGTFTTNALGTPIYDATAPATCTITLSQGFWMGRYEFTQKQWAAILGEKDIYQYIPDCPMNCVSWNGVQDCLDALNEITGETFRLPTSAEWEHAYRVGTSTRFYWGENLDDKDILYRYIHYPHPQDSYDYHFSLYPVGEKLPNSWGLYDMAGNISEWCQDGFYYLVNLNCPAVDPVGPEMSRKRTLRGGYSATCARGVPATQSDYTYGFRVVLPEKNQSLVRKDTAQ